MKLRLSVMWPPQHLDEDVRSVGKDVEKATEEGNVTVFAANTFHRLCRSMTTRERVGVDKFMHIHLADFRFRSFADRWI